MMTATGGIARGSASISELRVGLATDTAGFDAAFRLVSAQYGWRGYATPSPTGRRLSVHNALPSTKVFVARIFDQVIGTVTLVQDSLLGLPLDELYKSEVSAFRAQGRRIAEVSALATAPEYRRAGIGVVLQMMRMLVLYAAALARLDDLCITVNPRHVEFYRSYLRFATIGPERAYGKVNGAPAVAMRLDLDLARRIGAAVQSGDDTSDIHRFFFATENCAAVFAQLRADLPRAHFRREHFEHFFGDDNALRDVPDPLRQRVQALYAPVRLERPCELPGGPLGAVRPAHAAA